jgi:hypothetical protein
MCNDEEFYTAPEPKYKRQMKCLDEVEYYNLMGEIHKVRNTPYVWWVREKMFSNYIEINFAVTVEACEDLTAVDGWQVIADKIIEDIKLAYKNRK